jgi:hypothetical protein
MAFLGLFCLSFFSLKAQEKRTIESAPSKITQLSFFAPIEKVHIENSEDFVWVSKDQLLNLSFLSSLPLQTYLVVTLKGNHVFSFVLTNTLNPFELTYVINKPEQTQKEAKTRDFLQTCQKILKNTYFSPKKKTKGLLSYLFTKKIEIQKAKVKLTLVDLVIHQNKMYFFIELQNNSLIDFHIQEIAFETKAKVGKKKVSLTLRKLPLLTTCQALQRVPALTTSKEVLVLDSFSLSKEEELELELLEAPGGKRHLKLKIPTLALEKAKLLN